MNESPPPPAFSLRLSVAAAPPADANTPPGPLPPDLPASVNGQSVSYAWKEAIRAGRYVHPATGQVLHVTPARIDLWLAAFRAMQARGVKVYVPVNHSARTEDNRGYVVDACREGGRLRLLHQLIGDDARRDAARSEVSLRIVPSLRDGTGHDYGEAIEHSSLVVDPVVPGQGPFEAVGAIAASRGAAGETADDGDVPVFVLDAEASSAATDVESLHTEGVRPTASGEQVSAVRELIHDLSRGGLEGPTAADVRAVTPENAMDTLVALARRMQGRLAEAAAVPPPVAPAPDEATLVLLSRSLRTEREAAVGCGAVSPACAAELDQLLCEGGRPTPLALSRTGAADDALAGAGEPLAFRLWSILRRNRPVDLGQRSGVQSLTRLTPADDAGGDGGGRLPYADMAARYNRRAAT